MGEILRLPSAEMVVVMDRALGPYGQEGYCVYVENDFAAEHPARWFNHPFTAFLAADRLAGRLRCGICNRTGYSLTGGGDAA